MRIFSEGDELYESMHRDIAAARSIVRLELYLFADDEVGTPFVKALCRKAREGVDVVVRVDTIGSLTHLGLAARYRMLRSGVRLTGAPRPAWRQLQNPNRRDHRKLLVIDDHAAYLGGFNIHKECSKWAYGEKRWRDLHVRFGGSLVHDAADAFDAYGAGQRDWRPARREPPLLISNHSRACRFRLYCSAVAQLRQARRRIWITSPYFVPNHGISQQLREAARRGVDVRVLVPGHGDVPIVRWATAVSVHRLAKAGVRVYRYLPRMHHAKAILVDDDSATIGTANIDYRSLFLNDELNLVTQSPAMNSWLSEWFEAGFEDSAQLDANRPTSAQWGAGLMRFLAWRFRRWL